MTELETLFVVVALVYLAQCIVWVGPGSSVFALGGPGKGTRRKQGFIWNAFELAGVAANPLPPLRPLVVADWPDFQISPEGCCYRPREGPPVAVPWEKLAVTTTESRLLCNGSPVLKAGETQIGECAEMLSQLRKLKSAKRQAAIEGQLRRRLRETAVRRKLLVFRRRSQWLRALANLQFFLLFVAAPLGFRLLGLKRMLWPLIAAVALLSISITTEFWILHKAVSAKAGGDETEIRSYHASFAGCGGAGLRCHFARPPGRISSSGGGRRPFAPAGVQGICRGAASRLPVQRISPWV